MVVSQQAVQPGHADHSKVTHDLQVAQTICKRSSSERKSIQRQSDDAVNAAGARPETAAVQLEHHVRQAAARIC